MPPWAWILMDCNNLVLGIGENGLLLITPYSYVTGQWFWLNCWLTFVSVASYLVAHVLKSNAWTLGAPSWVSFIHKGQYRYSLSFCSECDNGTTLVIQRHLYLPELFISYRLSTCESTLGVSCPLPVTAFERSQVQWRESLAMWLCMQDIWPHKMRGQWWLAV